MFNFVNKHIEFHLLQACENLTSRIDVIDLRGEYNLRQGFSK